MSAALVTVQNSLDTCQEVTVCSNANRATEPMLVAEVRAEHVVGVVERRPTAGPACDRALHAHRNAKCDDARV